MNRRTLIRVLIVVIILTILVIEGGTFIRLLTDSLSGEIDENGGDTDVPDDRVTVGDELLPETRQTETLVAGEVIASEEEWVVSLVVQITNPSNKTYRFSMTGLETQDGDTYRENFSIEVKPGDNRELSGRWEVDAGDVPHSVRIVASDGVYVEREVELGNIPVSSG